MLNFTRAGTADADTHIHHTLVTVLGFGSVGALVGLVTPWPGFRIGLAIGLLYYAQRELRQRAWLRGQWWDAVCDIVVPAWIVSSALTGRAEALWIGALAVAILYVGVRPRPASVNL